MEDSSKRIAASVIEEQARNPQGTAPEPGDTKVGSTVEGSDNKEAPMSIKSLTSAGYTYIWDTVTGERSITNNNMLTAQLRKKRPDGSYVFTMNDPHIPLKRGNMLCMLHPDAPNRGHYDEIGLPTCRKSNLTNEHQVKQHMKHRHKVEWETIEEERKATEGDALTKALKGLVDKAKSK